MGSNSVDETTLSPSSPGQRCHFSFPQAHLLTVVTGSCEVFLSTLGNHPFLPNSAVSSSHHYKYRYRYIDTYLYIWEYCNITWSYTPPPAIPKNPIWTFLLRTLQLFSRVRFPTQLRDSSSMSQGLAFQPHLTSQIISTLKHIFDNVHICYMQFPKHTSRHSCCRTFA